MSDIRVSFVGDLHLQENPPRARVDNYLESLLSKIDSIAGESDIVVFLGDVFSRKILSTQCYNSLFKVLNQRIKTGVRFYTIVGNHDIYNMNMGTVEKTGIGLLSFVGVVPILEREVFEGVVVESAPLLREPTLLKAIGQESSILLGHYFYESDLDESSSIKEEQVEECGYNYLILGHDHASHEPLQVGKTIILRSGSVARNTSHVHNLERMPSYYQFLIGEGRIKEVSLKEVSCAKLPREVFAKECFEPHQENSLTFLTNIDDLINAFSQEVSSIQKTINRVLSDLKAPEIVVEYIKSLYERNNLIFK